MVAPNTLESFTLTGKQIQLGKLQVVPVSGQKFDHALQLQTLPGTAGDWNVEATAPVIGANSTIGIVATNARLNKTEMTKVAQMAQDGFARMINPSHSMMDGDTIFAVSTGTSAEPVDLTTIGAIAAEVMAHAVTRGVLMATSIPNYPAHRDMLRN